MNRKVVVLALASLVAGCAYPISKELRQKAAADLTFAMVLGNPDAYRGSIVIWGGHIIETRNRGVRGARVSARCVGHAF